CATVGEAAAGPEYFEFW
nr:immunoglobulin heavy chain junction region [Macaca mulatta]MOW76437.1 immunoglobulin heavy chain junction region [Macaca mulatta]MOW77198.1 immunoglobulin heavy chain junction region [Macaca mulatta]MOW77675.1 immunoglobulin heavy chain junction region [Macaca mulatta]MOW77978.1 immunoglobulin heavy chain junction region [Macaca mulatta]